MDAPQVVAGVRAKSAANPPVDVTVALVKVTAVLPVLVRVTD
jgi:hypothetical protein